MNAALEYFYAPIGAFILISISFEEGHLISWLTLPAILGLSLGANGSMVRATIIMYLMAFSHDGLIYLVVYHVVWSLYFYPLFACSLAAYAFLRHEPLTWVLAFVPYLAYLLIWDFGFGFQTSVGYNFVSFTTIGDLLEIGSWLVLFISLTAVEVGWRLKSSTR